MGQQIYTSGSGTFSFPAGSTNRRVLVIGGGGGGFNGGPFFAGNGGGGGGCAYESAFTAGDGPFDWEVGVGGTEGGGTGSDSTFDTLVGGGSTVAEGSGSPGTGSGGSDNYHGGYGGLGDGVFVPDTGAGGGGGSSAGPTSNGNTGQNGEDGGLGGAAPDPDSGDGGFGAGDNAGGGSGWKPGEQGKRPGGGGGGGGFGGAAAAGGSGVIQIDWDGGEEDPDCDEGYGPYSEEPDAIYADAYSTGTAIWSYPDNAISSSVAEISWPLIFDQFFFSIPEDQIIVGVEIEFTNKIVTSGTVNDRAVQLIVYRSEGGGGSSGPEGEIKSGTPFGETSVYGGPTDTWGLGPLPYDAFVVTGSGFLLQAESFGAAEYSIESATMTLYTAGGVDGCEHKREFCNARGTGTAMGKQVQISITDDADDGTFGLGFFSDAYSLFGQQGGGIP